MQRLVEVRKRMGAIEDIRDVARTMATVASAKLSRTRHRAAGMRVYAERVRAMLQRQQGHLSKRGIPLGLVSPLFEPRPVVREVLLLHLSGDRGMCGNYNIAVDRLALGFVTEQQEMGRNVRLITKGTKGERFMTRKTDAENVHGEAWPRAGVTTEDVDRLREMLEAAFLEGRADEVWCAYTRFHSPIRRVPALLRLLPIEPDTSEGASRTSPDGWAYEERFSQVVQPLVELFLRVMLEDVLLESFASEQGARMITMEEATERADRKLHECRVLFNRLRREYITTDLLSVLYASAVRGEGSTD